MTNPDAGRDSDGGALTTRAAAAPAWRFALGGVVAAAAAVAANLAWRGAFPSVTGYALPPAIDTPSVVIASASSVLLGAGVYLLLSRAFAIATPLYVMGSLAAAGTSCIVAFAPVLPDGTAPPPGFPVLTIPMHVIAGVMAAVVVPAVTLLGVRSKAG